MSEKKFKHLTKFYGAYSGFSNLSIVVIVVFVAIIFMTFIWAGREIDTFDKLGSLFSRTSGTVNIEALGMDYKACLDSCLSRSDYPANLYCPDECGRQIGYKNLGASIIMQTCNYDNYSGRGESSGCASSNERCYRGTKIACGPDDDCSTLARAGDNRCHPLCNTNSDCSAGSYCESVQYFRGDVIYEYKLCVTD